MDQYDLMFETVQKRYNTVAAQYYRDHLRNQINNGNHPNMMVQQPDYEKGRERSDQLLKTTRQVVPYSNIDSKKVLKMLLDKENIKYKYKVVDKSPERKPKGEGLNDEFEAYVTDLEQKNVENVDHLSQLQKHQKELLVSKSAQQNIIELQDYMSTIITEIDQTLPPYFICNFDSSTNEFVQSDVNNFKGGFISEPYSELSDYLDKDDFTNLLRVLG